MWMRWSFGRLVWERREYMSVSLCIADPQGNAQTISVLRDPSKTSQISWARAVKLLRDRRLELEKTISDLTKDEGKKLVSLSLGEAAVVRLWPKLRARGFNTFDTIPRLNPTIARTKFSCPILGSADTADTLLFTEWLNNLREVEGHVASLELSHARPTLLPQLEALEREPSPKTAHSGPARKSSRGGGT